jgi:chemotaxis protein CheY-P-specific phosphatase CheC
MVTVEVLQEALSAAQRECEVALSQFLATEVAFELKEWAQRQADELLSALYSFAEPSQVRAIVVGVYGQMQGYLILLLPMNDADRIASFVLGDEGDESLRESVLAELGNLATARLLMGMGKALRLFGESLPTPPETRVDFSGALLQSLAALLLARGQGNILHAVWQMRVRLPDGTAHGLGHFFLPL